MYWSSIAPTLARTALHRDPRRTRHVRSSSSAAANAAGFASVARKKLADYAAGRLQVKANGGARDRGRAAFFDKRGALLVAPAATDA
jgi:hypothetical protein